ncbi:MAG TPA: hypothetical protein VF940_17165 [Streptosporangiaceae bacterium]
MAEAADDPPVVGAERERIADRSPQYADDADGGEGLSHHGDDALLSHQAAVEERQSWDHKEHKGG